MTILLPLKPLLASSISAVPVLCSASAEFRRSVAEAVAALVVADELVELVDPVPEELDVEEELDEDELLDVEAGVGAVGWKKLLAAPNPIFGAKAPPTDMVEV